MRRLLKWLNPWGILAAVVIASIGAQAAWASAPGTPGWQSYALGAPGIAALVRMAFLLWPPR